MTKAKLTLTVDENHVLFIDSNGNEIYNIRKVELPEIRNNVYSEWVMHLLTKTWITIEVLYDLAILIAREYPENSINWYATFFAVEKKNYLEYIGDVTLPEEESVVEDIFNKIDLGRKEANEETNQIIDEIVNRKLAEYNLF